MVLDLKPKPGQMSRAIREYAEDCNRWRKRMDYLNEDQRASITPLTDRQIACLRATDNLWRAYRSSQDGSNPVPYVIEAMAAMKDDEDVAGALLVLTEPILWQHYSGPMRWLVESSRQRLLAEAR